MIAKTIPFLDRVASDRARVVAATLPQQTSLTQAGLINLANGTPDFPTPPHIVEAGRKALAEGGTAYTPWAGLPELRQAIADKLLRENGIKADPASEIVVTAGSMAAILAVILAVVGPGEEVIIPVPFFEEYRRHILLADGVLVPVRTLMKDNYQPNPDDIERAVTPRTKAIVLISPSNPTGAVLRRDTVERVAELARRHDLLIVSDELYERFVYDGNKNLSFAALPGMWERTVTINGPSKCYGMTGWRVGYLAAPAQIIRSVLPITHAMTICAPTVSQWATLSALTGPHDWFDDILAEYDRRRHTWMQALDSMGLPYGDPQGAYYLMFEIASSTGMSSQRFAEIMLQEAKVIIGGGGGTTDEFNEGYCRASLAVPMPQLEEGLAKMATIVARYRKS